MDDVMKAIGLVFLAFVSFAGGLGCLALSRHVFLYMRGDFDGCNCKENDDAQGD